MSHACALKAHAEDAKAYIEDATAHIVPAKINMGITAARAEAVTANIEDVTVHTVPLQYAWRMWQFTHTPTAHATPATTHAEA